VSLPVAPDGSAAELDVDLEVVTTHEFEPVVMGSLDKELVRLIVYRHLGEVRRCEGLQQRLPGKVAVKFVIAPTGAVATAKVAETSVKNAELETCIVNRVKTWQFPMPDGGGVVIVTWPFELDSSGGR
jgi:TonB family protein